METVTVGLIYRRYFSALGRDFGLVVLIGLISYTLPSLLLAIAFGLVGDDIFSLLIPGDLYTSPGFWLSIVGIFIIIIIIIIIMLFSAWNVMLLSHMVLLREQGVTPRLGAILRRGLAHFLPVTAITLLASLAALAGCLLIFPGIIIALAFSLAIPVFMMTPETGAIGALLQSAKLTAGRLWLMLQIMLPALMASYVLSRVLETSRFSHDTQWTFLFYVFGQVSLAIFPIFVHLLYPIVYLAFNEAE